jgi:hypothetical protein
MVKTKFEEIKINIIKQLEQVKYTNGDLSDIGNEIGVAIGKYTMKENAEAEGLDAKSFICGLKHGISLIDGTH